jgi:hypothetical protein
MGEEDSDCVFSDVDCYGTAQSTKSSVQVKEVAYQNRITRLLKKLTNYFR